MKKRNAAIGGFLLLAVGAIGVGFAALTDTLNVTGTVTNGKPSFYVEFDETKTTTTGATMSYTEDTEGHYSTATVQVTSGLTNKGNTVVIPLVVEYPNQNIGAAATVTATVTDKDADANDEYYSYTVSFEESGTYAETAVTTIAEASTATVYIKVTMDKTATDDVAGAFSVELNANIA